MNERQALYHWLLSCPVEWRVASDNKGFTIVTFEVKEQEKSNEHTNQDNLQSV